MKKTPQNRSVLIVCEGRETEYNYFVGLRNTFNDDLTAMALSVKVKRGKGGNACNIVENAIREKKDFERKHRRCDHVFLLMDTEGPGRATELPAAEKMARINRVEIVYSSPSFEYWLLCHFQNIPRRYFNDCDSLIMELDKQWKSYHSSKYEKADEDIFVRLECGFEHARKQALEIDLHHLATVNKWVAVNPSSQVYELVGFLLGIKSGEKCPISGHWKVRDDSKIAIPQNKGDLMPDHQNQPTHWRI